MEFLSCRTLLQLGDIRSRSLYTQLFRHAAKWLTIYVPTRRVIHNETQYLLGVCRARHNDARRRRRHHLKKLYFPLQCLFYFLRTYNRLKLGLFFM